MRLLMPKARYTNGESCSASGDVSGHYDRDRSHVGGRFADRLSVQSMVRVFFADAGSRREQSSCGGQGVRHADGPERGYRCDESDDFDPDWVDDETVEGTVSRFDICTDYASSLYIEQPDRHPGVDGWDGGLHIVRKRDDREYDFDNTESECDDTE